LEAANYSVTPVTSYISPPHRIPEDFIVQF